MARAKIPVTLLTGYLGAGKTTLANALVSSLPATERVAVIVNEFGEIGIDGALLAETAGGDRVFELANGCLCCVVTGEFRRTLERVSNENFTRVLIETSGAADPTSVLKTFWGAPELTAHCRLDGVVCVADAERFADVVEKDPVALTQASVADLVLLTRTSAAQPARLARARELIARLNPVAAVIEHDFSGAEKLSWKPFLALDAYRKPGLNFFRLPDAQSLHGGLASVAVSWEGSVGRAELQEFFRSLALDDKVLRLKAILYVTGEQRPWLIQGVQSWMERSAAPASYHGPNRLVVLGRGLDTEGMRVAIDRLKRAPGPTPTIS